MNCYSNIFPLRQPDEIDDALTTTGSAIIRMERTSMHGQQHS
jgi:hypothetical protein